MDSDPPKEMFDADQMGEVHPGDGSPTSDPADQNISRELSELAESLDTTQNEIDETIDEKSDEPTEDGDLLLDNNVIEALLNSDNKGESPSGDPPPEDALSPEGMDDRLDAPDQGSAEDLGEGQELGEESTPPPEAPDPPPTNSAEEPAEAERPVAERVGTAIGGAG